MSLRKFVFVGLAVLMLGLLLLAWQLSHVARDADGLRKAVIASSKKAGGLLGRLNDLIRDEGLREAVSASPGDAGGPLERLNDLIRDEELRKAVAAWVNSSARMNDLLKRLHSELVAGDGEAARGTAVELRAALVVSSPIVGEDIQRLVDVLKLDADEGSEEARVDLAALRGVAEVIPGLRADLGDAAGVDLLDRLRSRAARGEFFAGVSAVFALVIFVALAWAMAKLAAERQLIERDRESQRLRRVAYGDRARVLASVNQITEVFGETHDVDAVLDEAVRAIREILAVDNIVLELYESRLRRHIVKGESGDVDLGDEMYDDVIGRGQSRLINRLDSTPQFARLAEKGFRSLLVTPLFRNTAGGEKEPIGFVAALCEKRRDFTTHDQWLLNTFARQASLIIENAQLYERTQSLAMHDGLTNLYNHRRFREVLDALLTEAARKDAPLGLIMGDIDNFKNYNDTHGHLKGDVVLRTVGDIMRTSIRGADTAARYGGEEFVILLPDTDLHGCRLVGENLRAKIQQHEFEGQERQPTGNLTITFGLAMYPTDGQDAESLIEAADQALYAGKHLGRNRLVTAAEIPDLEKEHGERPAKKDEAHAPKARPAPAARKPAPGAGDDMI